MRLAFSLEPSWPPGAWLARGSDGGTVVRVQHGKSVAVHGDWFGELVWDGDYDNAGFDQTDLVYGTGGKLDGACLRFVPSSMTTDRLVHSQSAGLWTVSNSLPCLIAATGTTIDPLHGGYRSFFASVTNGLDAYARRIPTTDTPLQITYV
ncbi:MAG: hypothetical protein AAF596_03730, partial [Planctomycetota bacterium]